MTIKENVQRILSGLPEGVELVAAAKTRQSEEILEAIQSGVKIIGENYVQEAERAYATVGNKVSWHFVGHLQRNKVKKAVGIFHMIETVDSLEIAKEFDKRCDQIGKVMPVRVTRVGLIDKVKAIDTLNKMDKIYSDGAQFHVDNRKVIFLIGKGYADDRLDIQSDKQDPE